MATQAEVREQPRFNRRSFLRIFGVVTTGALVGMEAASHDRLPYGFDITRVSKRSAKVLSIAAPGFLAEIDRQAKPVLPVFDSYGDSMLCQPRGNQYKPELAAPRIAEIVEQRGKIYGYDDAMFVGISMGGLLMHRVMTLLQENRTFEDLSIEPSAVMVDAPTGIQDLVGPFRMFARGISALPVGAGVNAMYDTIPHPGIIKNTSPNPVVAESVRRSNKVPATMAQDQAASIANAKIPAAGSLAFLKQMNIWVSTYGGDMVDPETSTQTWRRAVSDANRTEVVPVEMPHAGLEVQPMIAQAAMAQIYFRTLGY